MYLHPSFRFTVFVASLLIVSLLLPCAQAQEESGTVDLLEHEWKYGAGGTIKAFAVADLDLDGSLEILAASQGSLQLLDSDGKVLKTYPLEFTPSVLKIANTDSDPEKEILVGSGWIETTDLDVERFDFSDPDEIKEKESLIYKITRNRGDVYIIDGIDGKPVKMLEVGEWIRDIAVDDLDYDGEADILVGTGGLNIDYIEKISTETNEETGNLTYVRNYTTESYEVGRVMVYSPNGSLKRSYNSTSIYWYIAADSLEVGGSRIIIAGSDDLQLIDLMAEEKSTLDSPEGNYSIRDVITDNVGGMKDKSIIAGFVSPTFSGVFVMDKTGHLLWNYREPAKNLRGLFSLDIDDDAEKEIVYSSEKTLYVLDGTGRLEWYHTLPGKIDGIGVIDLEGNGYVDFVLYSGSTINVYEMSEDFIKSSRADRSLKEAEDYEEIGKYDEALGLLKDARAIYVELSDTQKISECDDLMDVINKKISVIRKETAYSLYHMGLAEYHKENFEKAKDFYEKALEIYTQLNDSEGISKCEKAMRELSESTDNPSTTTLEGSVDDDPEGGNVKENSLISPVMVILSIVVLTLLLYLVMKQRKPPGKEGDRRRQSTEKSGGVQGDEFSDDSLDGEGYDKDESTEYSEWA